MATGNYTAYTQKGTRYIRLYLTETTNTNTNTSNIHYQLYFGLAAGGYQYNTHNAVTMTLGGQTIISTSNIASIYYSSGALGERLLAEGDWSYAHNNDGTGSFAVYCQFNQKQSSASGNNLATISETFVCSTIPRASTIASVVSPATLYTEYKPYLTVSRKITGATHTVTYWVGNAKKEIYTKSAATSFNWKPPLELAKEDTSATSLSGTILVDTYNGNTKIDTVSRSITFSVPSSVAPTISSVAITEAESSVSSKITGAYVQGKSKLKISVTPSIANTQGAKIKSCSITVTAKNSSGTTYSTVTYSGTNSNNVWSATTGTFSQAGTVSIVSKVTDTRGRTASNTTNVTIQAYAAPTVDVTAYRCNSDGTRNDEGENIHWEISGGVSSIIKLVNGQPEEQNSNSWSVWYVSGGTQTQVTTSETSGIITNASGDSSYTIYAKRTDKWTSSQVSEAVGTAFVLVDYLNDGKGIAFGKVAETSNMFEENMPARFNANLTVKSTDAEDRLIRLQNSVRNVRQEVYATGYWGFYDDTNGEWIIRSDPSTRNINIPHRLLLEGHSSAIGDIYEGTTASGITLTANAWTTVVSNNFPAGSWIITGYVTIPTGNQGAGITITMSSIGNNFARQSVYANGGASYSANVTGYIKLTETTAITLQVWSASAISVNNCRIRGMRIA